MYRNGAGISIGKVQCFPRLLPIGGFWSWKLEFDSFVGKGAVRFDGLLKVKLAVGGFNDEPRVMLEAVGVGIVFPQTATYLCTLSYFEFVFRYQINLHPQ